jgi:hypothetical protein
VNRTFLTGYAKVEEVAPHWFVLSMEAIGRFRLIITDKQKEVLAEAANRAWCVWGPSEPRPTIALYRRYSYLTVLEPTDYRWEKV